VAAGAAVSAERALQDALIAALAADEGVQAVLGDPARVSRRGGELPAYPYFEVSRHVSEPAGSAAVDGTDHRLDLAIVSRNDGGVGGLDGMAAVRQALVTLELPMAGWRCILLAPVFMDQLRQGGGVYRAILRIRAVVEED
jgi:hypothetical protein